MRDQHWEQCHQEGRKESWLQQTPDDDEIQPLLFDLVRADKVELVKSLTPQLAKCDYRVKGALLVLAAGSSSAAMVDLLKPGIYFSDEVLAAAIIGNNIETFTHLLHVRDSDGYSRCLSEILKTKSEVFRLNWEINVDAEYEHWNREKLASRYKSSRIPFGDRYTQPSLLKAAIRNPENESFILSIWGKLNLAQNLTQNYLGSALVNVASSCCSVKLAKYLIDARARVDHRRSSSYMTPLHHAVTHDTPEAAELVKFLLDLGADPTAFARSGRGTKIRIRRIRDEVGAKGISKWLGMSWDDLVEKIRSERMGVDKIES
jgi:hypothetical protein